jgi:cytochrome c-type biogenesis protein CcmH
MGLWIVLIGMTAVAALIVVLPMLRFGRQPASVGGRDVVVYADQLAELERDAARGVIGIAEAEAARIEIGRRILRAGERESGTSMRDGRRASVAAAILIGVTLPLVSIGLYLDLGSPKLPDAPLAARKAKPAEQLSPEELVARLDQQLAARPDDVRGWDIAGPMYMRLGRYADAVNAFQTAIRLAGANLQRQTGLGEALTANAQGVVTSEARAAFEAAARLEPHFPLPKMYLALALSQDGRLQESIDAWKAVIATANGPEPWAVAARRELAEVEARLAEQNGAPAPNSAIAPNPAIEPGAQSMIESMVARLSDRLNAQGGTPEEWGRLIKSDLVLGRTDDAKAAYEKAKTAFMADPSASAQLASIATELGLTQ